jgi:hypothetical protein
VTTHCDVDQLAEPTAWPSLIQLPLPQGLRLAFSVADIAADKPPSGQDLIICRHALFHNTNTAVKVLCSRLPPRPQSPHSPPCRHLTA